MFGSVAARRLARVLVPGVVSALVFAGLPGGAAAASPNIVVSQVYGGGGNTGATYTHDFIELFNRGTAVVSVAGWSVQYASATGTGNFGSSSTQITELPSVSLAPGQYLLIQEAPGTGGTTPLPSPDVIDATPIAMGAGGGKVALVNTTTPLGCNGSSIPCSPAALATIVDLVGYGTANFFEGAGPTPAPGNTTAVLRGSGGCQDTDSNNADFSAGAPNPRTTSWPFNPCPSEPVIADCDGPLVTSEGTEADAAVSATDADGTVVDISISSVTPSPAPGTITLGDLVPAGSPGGTATATVTVDASVPAGVYAVLVTATNDDATPQTGTCTLSVRVTTSALIRDIQGSSHTSPLVGVPVTDVPGVVSAVGANGFYFQDPAPDADDATSEGLFVFTGSAPAVAPGDSVQVDGQVSEFRPGGSGSVNLTTTELTGPSIAVISSGNALPAPTVVGSGGRVPPGQVIEDDATGDVETSGVFDPGSDGIDFYESLEGMRVQVNDAVAVGPTNAFGEIAVVGDDGANASVRTGRGGIVIRPSDFNPERIILDDVLASTPVVDVGDGFSSALGVMDYSFGNFKLLVTATPVANDAGLSREDAAAAGAGQLSVASFNLENLDPGDGARIDELASEIVDNLRSPDLIGVQEVQDDNGPTNDAVVASSLSFAALIGAIESAGGPTYDFRVIDPVDDQDGGEPGGNIRVGFLFRTDRGLAFVDRPGGTPTAATTVVSGSSGPELSFSPGRIDPTNPAFAASRKPLAAEFTHLGRHLFVIVNHLNSKGGDQPLFGHFQPPTLTSEAQRIQQAQVLNDFVDSVLALDASADVVVLGDLNDFEFSAPLATLEGGVLTDLVETLPQDERYTYVFEGNSQTLDHILVSDHLLQDVVAFDVVHMNAEFAVQPTDHDPPVVRLCTDATAPTLSASVSPSVLLPPNHKYRTVQATVTVSDLGDPSVTATLVSVTSNEPDDAPGGADGNTTNDVVIVDQDTFRLRAERSEVGSGRVYTITYQATDACGNSIVVTATVEVPARS
jgi:hypothetical protein